MNRDAPFFLSDPRPEEYHDPDDPRPEEYHDPDDPRPEEYHDPDDPRPEEYHDPDDPRPEEYHDPDDPRPEEYHDPDDPRPEEYHDPDDPAVRRALRLLRPRRRRQRPPSCRPRRVCRKFPIVFSGSVIVRLADHPRLPQSDDIGDLRRLADELGLAGLARVLDRHELTATGRLVEVHEQFREDKQRCRCKSTRVESADQSGTGQVAAVDCACGVCPPVRELERRAAAGGGLRPLHSLANYWRVDVRDQPKRTAAGDGEMRLNGWEPSHEQTARKIVRELNGLAAVDLAYRELAAADPAAEPEDDYSRVQEYLDRAPVGINARWAWRQLENEGCEVGLVDLEQGWVAHEDLEVQLPPLAGDDRHNRGGYRGHHGTAVLGVIGGRRDRRGVRGIVRLVRPARVASHYRGDPAPVSSGHVARAIRQAIPKMEPGDVLLLEVQRSYLPTEVDEADRDAIRLAVSLGVVVVEAAGNGNADLDHYVNELGERVLDRRAPGFRESGAILVGAARAARPHDRFSGKVGVGSNHGSRIDCFAYGHGVATAGYGDFNGYLEPDDVDEEQAARRAYTPGFAGTSAAAPIVAGAALMVQGVRQSRTGTRLGPLEMRRLLSDPATGTRQGRGVRGRIGVMPDLKRILRQRLRLVSDLYLRRAPGDEGDVTGPPRSGSCPDIVAVQELEEFGAAGVDGFDGIGECLPGQSHFVCVRMRNRGARPVENANVRVFWSEVATLITPDLLHEIGSPGAGAEPDRVEPGGRPVWSRPHRFRSPGRQPRHLCFTAIVNEPRDGDQQLLESPAGWPYFDWRQHRWFMRHPNVGCRNVHLVDRPSKRAPQTALPFLVTGTPDRARSFDFEIVRNLAPSVELDLAAQPALASRLRRWRLWRATPPAAGERDVTLHLPRQPRLLVERVRLVAGASFPCRLLVGKGIGEGDSLVVRQLYRGREVGRITWIFRRRRRRRQGRPRPRRRKTG